MTRSCCVWSASRNRRFPSKDGYPFLFHSSGIVMLSPFTGKGRMEVHRGISRFPANVKNRKSLSFFVKFFG
jgi:hypothetical protein